jgi:hypothetical protein
MADTQSVRGAPAEDAGPGVSGLEVVAVIDGGPPPQEDDAAIVVDPGRHR